MDGYFEQVEGEVQCRLGEGRKENGEEKQSRKLGIVDEDVEESGCDRREGDRPRREEASDVDFEEWEVEEQVVDRERRHDRECVKDRKW